MVDFWESEYFEAAVWGVLVVISVIITYVCGGFDQIKVKVQELRRIDKNRSDCAICCCDLEVGVKVAKTPCGHVFHYRCLREWSFRQNTCPVCRADLGPDGVLEDIPASSLRDAFPSQTQEQV
ncbi:unnamed protein product [Amoebophrya sp. A25]|nr:unnamed protein product [Amoebophrya sp. A25]|eukprot:GSA25T00015818001.1